MNTSDLATLIPMAIGFALSPAALIELILVLFSKRRVTNSIAFVLALIVATSAALLLGALGSSLTGSTGGGTSTVVAWIIVAFGLLLLLLGVVNWRKRHDTTEPPVFQAIANMGPGAVAFLSLGVTFVNPKNLPLLLSAGATIRSTDAPWLAGAVFVLVGTLPYTAAMLYSLLGGERSTTTLEKVREWLIAHNRLIMGGLCAVLGLLMVVKGVAALP
jgi:threonine/homoserine/homoserine lactone efflux protein